MRRRELNVAVDWKCLDIGNGIASTLAVLLIMWHRSCRNAFNRIKLEVITRLKGVKSGQREKVFVNHTKWLLKF